MESYADVMNHSPDLQTGFNLVVCNYGLGRRDDIKKAFQKLVQARAARRAAYCAAAAPCAPCTLRAQ